MAAPMAELQYSSDRWGGAQQGWRRKNREAMIDMTAAFGGLAHCQFCQGISGWADFSATYHLSGR